MRHVLKDRDAPSKAPRGLVESVVSRMTTAQVLKMRDSIKTEYRAPDMLIFTYSNKTTEISRMMTSGSRSPT
jgi:hypothetical protein